MIKRSILLFFILSCVIITGYKIYSRPNLSAQSVSENLEQNIARKPAKLNCNKDGNLTQEDIKNCVLKQFLRAYHELDKLPKGILEEVEQSERYKKADKIERQNIMDAYKYTIDMCGYYVYGSMGGNCEFHTYDKRINVFYFEKLGEQICDGENLKSDANKFIDPNLFVSEPIRPWENSETLFDEDGNLKYGIKYKGISNEIYNIIDFFVLDNNFSKRFSDCDNCKTYVLVLDKKKITQKLYDDLKNIDLNSSEYNFCKDKKGIFYSNVFEGLILDDTLKIYQILSTFGNEAYGKIDFEIEQEYKKILKNIKSNFK